MPFELRDVAFVACSPKGKEYFRFALSELVGVFLDDTFPDEDFGAVCALVIVAQRHGRRRVHRYDVWPHDPTLHEALAALRVSAPHLVLNDVSVEDTASRLGVWTVERRTRLQAMAGAVLVVAICLAAFFAQ